MSKIEHESIPIGEKALWWTKVGGIIAAVVGVIREAADIAVGGGLIAASAIGLEGVLYKHKD